MTVWFCNAIFFLQGADLEAILGATAGALVMLNLDEILAILTKNQTQLKPQIEIKYN